MIIGNSGTNQILINAKNQYENLNSKWYRMFH